MSSDDTKHIVTIQESSLTGTVSQMRVTDSMLYFEGMQVPIETINDLRLVDNNSFDLASIGLIVADILAGGLLAYVLNASLLGILVIALISGAVGYVVVRRLRSVPFTHVRLETESGSSYVFGVATPLDAAILFNALRSEVDPPEESILGIERNEE